MGGIYVNLEKGFGHYVSTNGAVFSRLELATMKRVNFDTDTLGIYFSANRKFEMFKDKAMLWDAVSATTGDVKIVELNFETGEMTDHGVVKTADRKVTTLISVGG
jgi:hypothetical protein